MRAHGGKPERATGETTYSEPKQRALATGVLFYTTPPVDRASLKSRGCRGCFDDMDTHRLVRARRKRSERGEESPALRRRPGREPLRHCALPREADQQMGDGLVTERE